MSDVPGNDSPPAAAAPPVDGKGYWKANIQLTLILLAIWFTVSFVMGVLFHYYQTNIDTLLARVEYMDYSDPEARAFIRFLGEFRFMADWKIGGAPLGFWFAQQGSIYTFVVLIFVYCFRMNAIERKFGIKA